MAPNGSASRSRIHTQKKTLTWDRDMELAAHADFPRATRIEVASQHHVDQGGGSPNENAKKLIHQYLPKNQSARSYRGIT